MKSSKNKHKISKHKTTIDKLHLDNINNIVQQKLSVPKLQVALQDLKNEYNYLLQLNPSDITNKIIHRKSELLDEIQKIENTIEKNNDPTNFLLYINKTKSIIDEYYNKKNNVDITPQNQILKSTPKVINILSYFTNTPQNNNQVNNENNISLYDKYINATNINYDLKKNQYICIDTQCNGDKIVSADGYLVCQKCGLRDNVPMIHDKPCFKDNNYDVSTYAYKRINHLKEILSQLQAKETTEIPKSVYDKINNELKKKNINKKELGIIELRKILKKTKLHKYYEHTAHILKIINGTVPPYLTRQQEFQIIKNFKDIQLPYSLYCPKERKNFLNYNYYLHKICQLIGLHDLVKYFPLLKNNEKLKHHDKIWKKICNHLNWKFYPSI